MLRTTHDELVPLTDAAFELSLDVVSRKHFLFVKIRLDAVRAKAFSQTPNECLGSVAVTDEAGIELGLTSCQDQRFKIGDETLRHTGPPEEDLGDLSVRPIDRIDAD